VAVMYLGRIVERGPVREVIRTPAHPYTQGLLNALPNLEDLEAPLMPVPGDIPSPLERPPGCVFHTRCPVAIAGRCDTQVPRMVQVTPDHAAACFVVEDARMAS
jgi:peptide/nickel transport system ATP-binding protein